MTRISSASWRYHLRVMAFVALAHTAGVLAGISLSILTGDDPASLLSIEGEGR